MKELMRQYKDKLNSLAESIFNERQLTEETKKTIEALREMGVSLRKELVLDAKANPHDSELTYVVEHLQYAVWSINSTEKPIVLIQNTGRLIYFLDELIGQY